MSEGSHRTETGRRKTKQVHRFQTGAVQVQVQLSPRSALDHDHDRVHDTEHDH